MTNEELVILAQEGDELAYSDLFEQNKGLMYKVINNYSYINMVEKEDLIGQCHYGFVKAVNSFKPEKGKFSTLYYIAMNTEIQKYLESLNHKSRKDLYMSSISLSKKLTNKLEESCTLSDFVKYDDDQFEMMELMNDYSKPMQYAYNYLDDKYKPYIKDLLLKNKTQLEVAKELGMTKQMIGVVLKKFKKDMQEYITYYKNKELVVS